MYCYILMLLFRTVLLRTVSKSVQTPKCRVVGAFAGLLEAPSIQEAMQALLHPVATTTDGPHVTLSECILTHILPHLAHSRHITHGTC